ncbi:MAG TPA: EamA family transporter [Chloroflexota bacterium]|nr:EamA family transporter [Chloroflexota bacterium]
MDSHPAPRPRLLIEPLAATLLWGGVFTAAKIGLRDIPALSFITLRILIATAVLAVLVLHTRSLRLHRPAWRALILAGLAQTSFQYLLFQAINRTSASISAILLATAPLMTAGWLVAARRERLGSRQWLGLGLGIVGVALVVQTDQAAPASITLTGNLLALGSAVAWAWYGLAIGPLARATGSLSATAATLAIAGMLLLPLSIPELRSVAWDHVSVAAWAGTLYGSLLGLVLATILWVRSIHRWGTQPTMTYSYVEPVAAVVIAAIVLGEALHPIQGMGALLALAGVFLASSPKA